MKTNDFIKEFALDQGYTEADFRAGLEFYKRKNRLSNPPGQFDSAKRFWASEETYVVCGARTPSRAYPFSQMTAARTAKHCAAVFDSEDLHVKRIAKAIETLSENPASAHAAANQMLRIKKILKKVKS